SPARRLLNTRIFECLPVAAAILLYCFSPAPVEARPLRLLVLGDSLSSGFMLPEQAAFPYVLARRLHADGYGNVLVVNGAIAGDTTAMVCSGSPGLSNMGRISSSSNSAATTC
ncbi:MAG TPA: hypothetical protein VK779_00330, partial [Rhizomicrobium sp.]|nr:hypothetical protein [Rhizomicrobium sp.]